MQEILGRRSILLCITVWIRASGGPCAQMCLAQASIHSALTRPGHLCGGEGLEQASLALVKVVMVPALPSPLPAPPPHTHNPPNSTHSPRDHSALQEAPPQLQPSLPFLALECPQTACTPRLKLAAFCSHFPLTHLLDQHLLREYICSDGHYWRNKDWAPRHRAQNSHSSYGLHE